MNYNFYAIKYNDKITRAFAQTLKVNFVNSYRDLKENTDKLPVIFRSMAQRKLVSLCEAQGRDYYYIDTGYIGNDSLLSKRWYRVVKNNMQHACVNYNMPSTRFNNLTDSQPYLRFNGWKKQGKNILIVTPSEKPCKFYNIDKGKWLSDTIDTLKKYSDRNIIIREKEPRKNRMSRPLRVQLQQDDIYAVVTYNSIAAVEAICEGVPAFTSVHTVANDLCEKDLTKIESPLYEDNEKVEKWQHWLAYCQYKFGELQNGRAYKIIEDLEIK